MSDAVLITLIGAVGTLIKVVLDYKVITKQSSDILNQVVIQMKELKDSQETLTKIGQDNREGNQNMIRHEIRKEMNIALERGYEYIEHFSEVLHLYNTYKKLGGNGVIDRLFKKYEKLPLKEK